MPHATQVVDHYRSLADATTAEGAAIEGSIAELDAGKVTIEAEFATALADLAAIYLPALDAAHLAETERRTGFRGFTRMDPLKAMANERHRIEAELAHIRADERYVRREYLVGPNGEITGKLKEAEELYEPWQLECQKFESLDTFLELVQIKYDTPEFDLRWWQPSYWRIWAAGDRICATLGLNDFGDDVLPAYEKVRVPRDGWRAELEKVRQARDAVHELVQRHDQLVDRLDRLEEIYLSECRQALAAHLRSADPPLLAEWAGEDRGVEMALKKIAGLAAKIRYHEEITQGMRAALGEMRAKISGYNRKAVKFGQPKNHRDWPDSVLYAKGFESLEKARVNREKAVQLSQKVRAYDDYRRFELDNDPELWWWEMTNRRPSRYMHTSLGWYAAHPNVAVVYDPDEHDDREAATSSALAAAAADRALDTFGDVS